MTHLLRPAQNILVLLDDRKLDDLETKLRSSGRGLSKILSGETARPHMSRESALAWEVYRQKKLPWSEAVENACSQHRIEERARRWTALERGWQFCVESVVSDLDSQYLSKATLGNTVVAYSFLSRLYFGPMRTSLGPEQLKTYDAVAERLLLFLEPRKEEIWAEFLRFNVKANSMGLLWGATPAEQRHHLKDFFEKAQFYDRMIAYLDLYKRDCDVVHNALCYASSLGLTAYFQDLRERLRVAHGGIEPDYTDTDEFDSAFDNFRAWLKEE